MDSDVKRIPLSGGKFALVDAEDYPLLSRYAWTLARRGEKFYATTKVPSAGSFSVYMHRMILNPKFRIQIDHVDGNGLNNTKSNIRPCTPSQNHGNKGKQRGFATSPYKGVCLDKNGKWRAYINLMGKQRHIGTFPTDIDAARAYDAAAKEQFVEFARTNFREAA